MYHEYSSHWPFTFFFPLSIVFHSFRHYWAARMADHMEAEKLSRVTGHKSRAIFDHYANHIIDENLEEIGKIGAKVFGKILPSKTALAVV